MATHPGLRQRAPRDRGLPARRRRAVLEVVALEERALLSTMDADLITTATFNGTAVTSPIVTNAASVTVDFSAADPDESPPSALTTHLSVGGMPFTAGDTLTLKNEGNYTVQYFSTDAAGDFGPTQTLLVTIDRTAPTVSISSVSPSTLWPPNGKPVTVTVMGTARDNLSGLVSPLNVQVKNEAGYQGGITLPTTPVSLQPTTTNSQTGAALAGSFAFTVTLQARRFGFDFDGRQYTILVTARDAAGNSSTVSTIVTVPHDQGHHNGSQPGLGKGRESTGSGTFGRAHHHNHKSGHDSLNAPGPGSRLTNNLGTGKGQHDGRGLGQGQGSHSQSSHTGSAHDHGHGG